MVDDIESLTYRVDEAEMMLVSKKEHFRDLEYWAECQAEVDDIALMMEMEVRRERMDDAYKIVDEAHERLSQFTHK